MIFKTNYRLTQVNSPLGAFCNTFKLLFVIKIFVLSIFERPFYTGTYIIIKNQFRQTVEY